MKIIRIKYSALANTGNYENEKIELEAELNENDDLDHCLEELRTRVHSQLRHINYYQNQARPHLGHNNGRS